MTETAALAPDSSPEANSGGRPGTSSDGRPDDRPGGHPDIRGGRIGVIPVNLGTPDSVGVGDVRRYLREFLSDRRVIEAPRLVWMLVLNLIILPFRPRKTAAAYRKVADPETGELPLRLFTRRMTEALAARFAGEPVVMVDYAMRYGAPAIADVLAKLQAAGCDRILLLPLYPQYSATTSASVFDKAAEALRALRWQPALRVAPPWHDDPDFIETLAAAIEADMAAHGRPDLHIASFHGLPRRNLELGDPYYCQCAKTARLLQARLGFGPDRLRLTFQSRFGPAEWLQPYTDKTLAALPGEGVTSVAVVTPGFPADCVETLEEIAIGGREIFLAAGGKEFRTLPCLNDTPGHIDMLERMVRRELAGWLI